MENPPLSKRRPQMPHPPFDYTVEAVTFSNPKVHILLAGTMTLPRGPGPFAAAILISGSGPEDRDETIFGHKPFAVLADYLTRAGIAVLRFDDRGVEKSGGDFVSATTDDFASDVRAAILFLASQPKINPKVIGLIGHSQGGGVGPIAAVDNPSVAYLVLLAAPATSMTELLLSQRRIMGVMQGRTEATLAADEPTLTRLYEAVAKADDRAVARARVSAMLTPSVMKQLSISAALKPATVDQLTGDWLRVLLHYDAPSTLAAIHVPMLALNGSLDRQVPSAPNLAAIQHALTNNPDVTVRQLAGAQSSISDRSQRRDCRIFRHQRDVCAASPSINQRLDQCPVWSSRHATANWSTKRNVSSLMRVITLPVHPERGERDLLRQPIAGVEQTCLSRTATMGGDLLKNSMRPQAGAKWPPRARFCCSIVQSNRWN